MVNIENYISKLIDALRIRYGSKLIYVGLQGSYLRGEATDNSDIDIMVVLDELTVSDMDDYRSVIRETECFDKSCGFICGRTELANWNPLEICNLLNGTKDYYGKLSELVPAYTEHDIRNFVKLSLNNMYHEICHRYIHSMNNKSIEILTGTYKGVFFILQNLHYLNHGEFIAKKSELLQLSDGRNSEVLRRSIELNSGIAHDFAESFELLFTWCRDTLKSL